MRYKATDGSWNGGGNDEGPTNKLLKDKVKVHTSTLSILNLGRGRHSADGCTHIHAPAGCVGRVLRGVLLRDLVLLTLLDDVASLNLLLSVNGVRDTALRGLRA